MLILFGYFIVAPLSVQFFGSYQISDQIENNFTIGSYMSTILSTIFYSGLFFLNKSIKKEMLTGLVLSINPLQKP